ncbi:unnamed protein product [Brachionus calyciflorus]|uniref:CCHC-type domain-containing protein n=1 Tax=Brachionus calyciflorus TaxID=104777 RepID=A0A814NH79_9BILA|nr:unnamed protein product [Brachionus calyciflorus]
MYLTVMVTDKEDYELLNKNEKITIKGRNKSIILNKVNNTQIYLVAIRKVSQSFQLNKNVENINECMETFDLCEINRKVNSEGMPTDTLIGRAKDEEAFIKIIQDGVSIRGKFYEVEPWLFKPLQCLKCGKFGHKAINCDKAENVFKMWYSKIPQQNETNMTKCIEIVTLNCNGLRNNIMYVKELQYKHDIFFMQEMWCEDKAQVTNLLGNHKNYKIQFISGMEKKRKKTRGRGYGGIGWVINKRINNYKVTFINNRISIFKLNEYGVIGVYLTANDNKSAKKLIKENEFIQLSNIINELKKQFKVICIGDFNCDIIRNNEHDPIMNRWLTTNKLFCFGIKQNDNDTFTCYKNETTSWIDHIVPPIETEFI